MDIDKLEAGPELDALVAEKVMGMEPDGPWAPPKYSTDIAAAWEVLMVLVGRIPEPIGIIIDKQGQFFVVKGEQCDLEDVASASTAPLAICRAALKAVGA